MTRVLRGPRNVRKQDRPIKPCILFAWWAGDDDNPGLAQGRIWEGNPGPDAAQMPKYEGGDLLKWIVLIPGLFLQIFSCNGACMKGFYLLFHMVYGSLICTNKSLSDRPKCKGMLVDPGTPRRYAEIRCFVPGLNYINFLETLKFLYP